MKKTISIILALGILAAFSSCKKDGIKEYNLITSDSENTIVSQSPDEQGNSDTTSDSVDGTVDQTTSSVTENVEQNESNDGDSNTSETYIEEVNKEYAGSWICKLSDGSVDYTLEFELDENGDLYYLESSSNGETVGEYEGYYFVNGNIMEISMSDITGHGTTLTSVVELEHINNQLNMTLISGDSFAYLQFVGEALTFKAQ